MTVNELITQVKTLYDEDISVAQAVAWINECQQSDLMADCLIIGDTTIDATADTWASLPSDFLKLKFIEDDDGYRYADSYELIPESRKIKFLETDTYTIYYYKVPALVSAGIDTPEAHTMLHYPMVHYLYAKYRVNENGPNDVDGNKAMNDYRVYRDNVLAGLKRMATSGQTSGVER